MNINPTDSKTLVTLDCTPDERIETVIRSAQKHGEDEDPDHEVGDLQDALRAAWGCMSAQQRSDLMASSEMIQILEPGMLDDYSVLPADFLREEVLRVSVRIDRDADGNPSIGSIGMFDDQADPEIDWQASGIEGRLIGMLERAVIYIAQQTWDVLKESGTPDFQSENHILWDMKTDRIHHRHGSVGVRTQTRRIDLASQLLNRELGGQSEAPNLQLMDSPRG
ncbi:MAG: hypothetical protein EPN79_11460 [Burkholderiaceae bacterium]|nr:MAG: hypothetical protein EPN79_11460 [Burkholderiaceae bacterium]TBR76698.1 MAG: hypothetical protein EPN64_05605 [Burkholderiaceae bacterium]